MLKKVIALFSSSNPLQKSALWGAGAGLLALLASIMIGKEGTSAFIISFALVAGAAGVLLSLLYERFPLYLLVVLLPLAEMLKVEFIPSTLLIIPGSLAVVSLLAVVALRKNPIFVHSPILLLAVLLGVWASVAMAAVGSVFESRPYWLVIVLLFLIPNFFTHEDHLLRAGWLFMLPLGCLGVYVFVIKVLSYLMGQVVTGQSLHSVRFEVGDKNIVGLWLTLGIPFAYYLFGYYQKEPGKRFWILMIGVAILAGALATVSLGVVVGLCAMIGMIIWLQPDVSARLRSLALGIILIPLIFNGFVIERLQSKQILTPGEAWGTYRGELWSAGARTILDNPIFGIGLKPARRIAMLKYLHEPFFQQWYDQGVLIMPHNIFLSVGVDIGLPGLVLYLILLSSVLFSLWRLRHRPEYHENHLIRIFTNIFLVALITGWVQSMALSVHLDKLLWFLMGSTIALWNIVDEKGHNKG